MGRVTSGWAELVHRAGATLCYEIRNFRGECVGAVEITEGADGSWRWVRLDLDSAAGVLRGHAIRGLRPGQIARRAWTLSENELPTDPLPD